MSDDKLLEARFNHNEATREITAMQQTETDIMNKISDEISSALKSSGKINILIAGKTGVGKSTLINTVFRGNIADVKSGRPVTQHIEEKTVPGSPLSIFDSKGLELQDYEKILGELGEFVDEKLDSHDENKHIHFAWLCIHEDGRRVEKGEEDLCKMLKDKKIPVIVAITKHRADNGFRQEVENIFGQNASAVVSVRAIPETIDNDGEEITLKEKGVNELISTTAALIPEAKRRAYSNALSNRHTAAIKIRREQAENEVNIAAALAFTAGATPIPFSDSIVLIPIQAGMLAKISITFGMDASTATIATLISSILGSSAATVAGRALVTGVLKMVPGLNVAGGFIAATTASTLTKTLGNAYIKIIIKFMEENPGKDIDFDLIASEMKKMIF